MKTFGKADAHIVREGRTDVRDRWNPLPIVGAFEAVNPALDFLTRGLGRSEKRN
jgi:hypothetical protein